MDQNIRKCTPVTYAGRGAGRFGEAVLLGEALLIHSYIAALNFYV